MYEKYNCEEVGKAGGGGEYGVQVDRQTDRQIRTATERQMVRDR